MTRTKGHNRMTGKWNAETAAKVRQAGQMSTAKNPPTPPAPPAPTHNWQVIPKMRSVNRGAYAHLDQESVVFATRYGLRLTDAVCDFLGQPPRLKIMTDGGNFLAVTAAEANDDDAYIVQKFNGRHHNSRGGTRNFINCIGHMKNYGINPPDDIRAYVYKVELDRRSKIVILDIRQTPEVIE